MNQFPINRDFRPFYFVEKPIGRRFVVTDIHGFFDTFVELLNKIELTKNDQLFILGDMIDKGKKGKEVLSLIIELIDNGFPVFPLRGNHEDMLLKSHYKIKDKDELRFPILGKSKGIRDENRNIYPKYLRLLDKLPYYYELDDFLLVHAGFDFSKPNPFEDFKSMLWISEFSVNGINSRKTIIHGHKIQKLNNIKNAVSTKQQKIGLDNGTMHITNPDYGNMVCLNLDTFVLMVQRNIDLDK